MTQPLVTAVVLNYRNALQAVRCAKALLAQTAREQMEVFVVDNHSEDDSIGILRASLGHLPVRIIETPRNGGFGFGYNTGIHYANGRYILINNPDKILQPDAVERMVALLRSEPNIGILAPRLVHDDGTQRASIRSIPRPADLLIKRTFLKKFFPHRVAHYLQSSLDPLKQHDVDWVAGGCFMVEREFFQKIGGFDERYFLFFEDTDLCRRTWKAGKRVVYTPQISATDKKRRLSEMSALRMLFSPVGRAHIASAVKFFTKWRGEPIAR